MNPILKGARPKPGAHVNAVGSPHPTWGARGDAAMASALAVASREAVMRAFKSVGIAIEDVATVRLVSDATRARRSRGESGR